MSEPIPWLEDAKVQMRAEQRLGLVLRIPPDQKDRHAFGHAIERLVNSDEPGPRELLETLILVCLDGDSIQEQLPSARPEDTAIAIFADGDPFAGAEIPLRVPAHFARRVQELLQSGIDWARYTASSGRKTRRLPYGVRFGRSGGCGDACDEQPTQVLVRCGMGHSGPQDRSFLKFLSKRPK